MTALEEFKGSLPHDGKASVIVAVDGHVRYFSLDQTDFLPPPKAPSVADAAPAHAPSLAQRAKVLATDRRLPWGLLCLATLCVLALAAVNASHRQELHQVEQAIHAALPDSARDSGNLPLPQAFAPVARRLSAAEADLARRASELALREQGLRLHLEATRVLGSQQVEEMRARLHRLGIADMASLPTRSGGFAAAGGAPNRSKDQAALFQVLDDQLARLLLNERHLRDILRHLPNSEPLRGSRLTSRFGYRSHPVTGQVEMHEGVDLVSDADSRVFSAGSGEVVFAGYRAGYGHTVVVEHAEGLQTVYAHLRQINVSPKQWVTPVTSLGLMGSTGMSTGAHLHFEVRFNGSPVDPMRFLREDVHVSQVK